MEAHMDSLRKYQVFDAKLSAANKNNLPRRVIIKRVAVIAGLTAVVLLFGWFISR
jgi:hypothetical protein